MVKWGILVFGALFCTAVALVAAVVLADDRRETRTLLGYTAQDKLVNASIRDGRLFRFGTKVNAVCPGDQHWTVVWWPTVSDRATFGAKGNLVRMRAKRDVTVNWTVTEDLQLAALNDHGLLTGTVQAVVTVKEPFQAVCRSGPVRFFATHQ
jgi:hypothetical protein